MNQSHCVICSIFNTDTSVNLYSLSGRQAKKHKCTFYFIFKEKENLLGDMSCTLKLTVVSASSHLVDYLQGYNTMHLFQILGVDLHGPLYSESDSGFDQIQDMVFTYTLGKCQNFPVYPCIHDQY